MLLLKNGKTKMEIKPFIDMSSEEHVPNGAMCPTNYEDNFWKTKLSYSDLENLENHCGIHISLNLFGYRCKHTLPFNGDYAIAIGCSHTYGTALEEKYRYSNLVEDTLNFPVFNLGVQGGAPGLVKDNLFQLFFYLEKYNIKKPKLIIIQWPIFLRLWFGIHFSLSNWNPFAKKYLNKNEYMKDSNIKKIEKHNFMNYDHVNFLCQNNKIKKIEFSVSLVNSYNVLTCSYNERNVGKKGFEKDIIKSFKPHIDLAKDGEHPGKETNKLIHDYIIKQL